RSDKEGVNVGREWDYRSYITQNPGDKRPQTAKWTFDKLPASLASRPQVTFEYTFDVYRTTKGQEGEDVRCVVRLETRNYKEGNDLKFNQEREQGGGRDPARDSELAEKYGYYEIQGLGVTDYHTQDFTVPAGLFRNAAKEPDDKKSDVAQLTV